MEAHYPGKGAVSFAFPTPVLQKQFDDTADINTVLLRLVLEREADAVPAGQSAETWHSADDLFEWPDPAIASFRGYVADGISEISQFCIDGQLDEPVDIQMDAGAWVNLCRDGGYTRTHNNPDNTWSGVYFVALGEPHPDAPAEAGTLEILDPRVGATDLSPKGTRAFPRLVIDPQPGLMVIFPGWLNHGVNPFRGKGDRLSLGFNIKLNFDG